MCVHPPQKNSLRAKRFFTQSFLLKYILGRFKSQDHSVLIILNCDKINPAIPTTHTHTHTQILGVPHFLFQKHILPKGNHLAAMYSTKLLPKYELQILFIFIFFSISSCYLPAAANISGRRWTKRKNLNYCEWKRQALCEIWSPVEH